MLAGIAHRHSFLLDSFLVEVVLQICSYLLFVVKLVLEQSFLYQEEPHPAIFFDTNYVISYSFTVESLRNDSTRPDSS